MNTYMFRTEATTKDYRNYWIDSNIVREKVVQAETIEEALELFRAKVDEVEISKTALKNKQAMYIDKDGTPQQIGYVITAKTEVDKGNWEWVQKYVDLWVTVKVVQNPFTEAGKKLVSAYYGIEC